MENTTWVRRKVELSDRGRMSGTWRDRKRLGEDKENKVAHGGYDEEFCSVSEADE